LTSTLATVISAADVIQAKIDSYNATTGYVSFTDTWKGKGNARGCLRLVADPAKKRHGGAHAVMLHLSSTAAACTGDINQLPDTPEPLCGASTPRFFEMTLRSAPCTTSACGLLLGEFTGTVSVRALQCTGAPYSLSDSTFKAYNVSGNIMAFGFVQGPTDSFDQPIPMIVKSYDANTGQLRVQTFYSTLQCMTLDAPRLALGAFYASVPTEGTPAFFDTCPAPKTPVTGCSIGVYDFCKTGANCAVPKAASVPTATGAASTLEIIVAYLTIAIVAVALLVLQ
jgi:hypothetical protein